MKATIILIIALMTSGSAIMPDQEVKSNDDLRDKKLNLLEKLETGKNITPEDVGSAFSDNFENLTIEAGFPMVITHHDAEMIRESVRSELESIRHDISNLKNSDEFKKAMNEVRKASEEIKRELEKMREEIRMSDRRSVEWENG